MRGFVNILKPEGMTSSDVVVKARGILSRAVGERQKVGHLGTLDPLATGVLPIGVGACTRLFDIMLQKRKTYRAIFTFGVETDTLDRAGKIVDTCDFGGVENIDFNDVFKRFEGKISQIPPQYSSKSVGGRRAYDIAREGGIADLKPAEVDVYYIKRLEFIENCLTGERVAPDKNSIAVEICCGSGTYIRALARDIAKEMGTVGYMSYLERVACGFFSLENAVELDKFAENPLDFVIGVENVLNYPIIEIDDAQAKKLLNGVKISLNRNISVCDDGYALVKYNSDIVGVGVFKDGALSMKIRL